MPRRPETAFSIQRSALRAPRLAPIYGLHPQPCRGLRAGVFTDSTGQRHDLAKEKPVSAKQASADARMPDTPRAVLALVRAGQLYPVRKENARVIRIYPCAIADYWARTTRASAVLSA